MRIWSEISHLQENNSYLNVLILLFHFNLIPVLVGFFCKETKPYKISSVKLPKEKGIRLLKWALNSVLAYSLVEAGRLYFHG